MLEVLDLGSASQIHRQWQQTFPDPVSFSPEQIKSYWENIFGELDLPKGNNTSLNMAVPCYYDCLTRSIIINILTHDYGFQEIQLLPRSLALLCGYIALHSEDEMSGDWVCIIEDEDSLDFSFISISESFINLELQYVGSWSKLQEEALRLGLFSARGWDINKILYANPAATAHSHLPWADLKNNVQVIKVERPDQTIQLGLRQSSMISTAQGEKGLTIIYPYDFYLERFDSLTTIREKLSFDTANLDLKLNGTYKIASLPSQSLFLNPEDSYIDLAVYEVTRSPLLQNPFIGPPALDIRLNQADRLECLDIWLDMESASISLESYEPSAMSKASPVDVWPARYHKSQRDLAALLQQTSSNQRLQQDLAQDLRAQPSQKPQDLEDYLKTIQLKLYGLLELWSGVK